MPIPKRLSDGWATLDGGVNSGIAPNLINPNQYAFGINVACRGGWLKPRPGFKKCSLNFQSQTDAEHNFKNLLFQLGDGYAMDAGNGGIIAMIGGRQYLIDISKSFLVSDITIPGDENQPQLPMAWGAQGFNYYVIQNGSDRPFIFDGANSFRAGPTQIPVGKQITCYQNRFWVAKGRSYVAGNQAYDQSSTGGGTPSRAYIDSILSFTENDFLNEGGEFAVPVQAGEITGFKPIASVNNQLGDPNGQGELIVTTLLNAFATSVPQDRTQWKNTVNPLQRVIQLSSGVCSQDSLVNVNEDLFYRTLNGISTIAYSVRNQGDWGNRVLSTEVDRILKYDAQEFLPYSSGTQFNNRMLMTANPSISRGHGVWHRGLVTLDFFPISSISKLTPPAWDGFWTGLRFLKVFTLLHQSVERCFAFALNEFDEIELWEITKDDHFDYNGTANVRIEWSIESRSMNYGNSYEMKQLESSDFFFDELDGEADIEVEFRPDSYPCWIPWQEVNECAKTSMCAPFEVCPSLPNFKLQYRPKIQLQQPPDTFDPITGQRYRTFYELDVRMSNTGYFRIKQMRLNSTPFQLDFVEGKQLR